MDDKLYKIEDFDNYMITRCGKVWSKTRNKFLKARVGKSGYCYVTLFKKNFGTNKYIHRLLAYIFVENSENKPEINHKNGIKTDNRLVNLEWCTRKENIQHSYDIGLSYPPRCKGEKSGRSKLKEKDVLEIRELLKNRSIPEIAEIYNVSDGLVWFIKKKKIWTHI